MRSVLDGLLIPPLKALLVRLGWTDVTHWRFGLRAHGGVRPRTFLTLHTSKMRAAARYAVTRSAVLELLEQRANNRFADELELVTDSAPDLACERLLNAAGISFTVLDVKKARATARVRAGTQKVPGIRFGIQVRGEVRGVGGRARGQGFGRGLVMARLEFEGVGELLLPPGFTLSSNDERYQDGILGKSLAVRCGSEVLLNLFCLNSHARPSSSRVGFKIGPVVESGALGNVVRRLDALALASTAERKQAQEAIWDVVESRRLTPEREAWLAAAERSSR